MADYRWKGFLKVSLVQFPVTAKAAVRSKTGSGFNEHHADPNCFGRLQRGDRVCSGCGEQVGSDQVAKGFQGVRVDEEVIASLALDKTDVIDLSTLVPADEIDARYFDKSYDVAPQKGGERAYAIVTAMLERAGRVAFGKVVMRGTEYLVIVRPRDGILTMEVLVWPEDLSNGQATEAQEAIAKVDLSDQELALADQLARTMAGTFQPELLVNEQAARRADYLAALVAGSPAPAIPTAAKAPAPTTDLLSALTASLAANQATVDAKVAAKGGKPAARKGRAAA